MAARRRKRADSRSCRSTPTRQAGAWIRRPTWLPVTPSLFRAHKCSGRGAWLARRTGFWSCVHVQGLAGQREGRFADRLRLGWMRMDEMGPLRWLRAPVVDELAFGDELADPCADQVDAEHSPRPARSEEHTSELQSLRHLV